MIVWQEEGALVSNSFRPSYSSGSSFLPTAQSAPLWRGRRGLARSFHGEVVRSIGDLDVVVGNCKLVEEFLVQDV